MKRKRKWRLIGFVFLVILALFVYFLVPVVANSIVSKMIADRGESSVETVAISWAGPQYLSGLHLDDPSITADVDVEIRNGLISMLLSSKPITAFVKGSVIIKQIEQQEHDLGSIDPSNTDQDTTTKAKSTQQATTSLSIPALVVDVQLSLLTIEAEVPLIYHDVHTTFDVDPGHHCSATLAAQTSTNGTIEATLHAPNFIDSSGGLNYKGTTSLTFEIVNAAIPSFSGVGGWVVTQMSGEVSSPNLEESATISIVGSLTEYDTPRGSVIIKTQLDNPLQDGAFVFDERTLIGSIDVIDVPASVLLPFLPNMYINAERGFSSTLSLRITRESASNPLIGSVTLDGAMTHVDSDITVQDVQANIVADINKQLIVIEGNALIFGKPTPAEGQKTTFNVSLRPTKEEVTDDLGPLFTSIVNKLPHGNGSIEVKQIPSSLLEPYIHDKRIVVAREIGPTIDLLATLSEDHIDVRATSNRIHVACGMQLNDNTVTSLHDVDLIATIGKSVARAFTGAKFENKAIVHTKIARLDFDGSTTFDTTIDIGKQHTVVRGNLMRVTEGDAADNLDLHVIATGVDIHLLDAIAKTKGLLVDTLGTTASIETRVQDVLNTPIVTASGTSPYASFDTEFTPLKNRVSTVPGVPTRITLQLSPALTKRLLKDLGPVLADIRSVKHPILLTMTRATASLKGNLKALNADLLIDIGEVELASGSLTMQLLPLFNSTQVDVIPAFFEPIHIEIRKGIIRYKEFKLTIANKYSIPYSGTINLITKRLRLKSTVPLTGLGYSIKELRGLATDIDVPLLITGTIDRPKVGVDPKFDLGKLLQSAALNNLGDSVGSLLGGNKGDDSNSLDPLKLLEDILDKE